MFANDKGQDTRQHLNIRRQMRSLHIRVGSDRLSGRWTDLWSRSMEQYHV